MHMESLAENLLFWSSEAGVMVRILLSLQNIQWTIGNESEIFKTIDGDIGQFQTEKESMLLADMGLIGLWKKFFLISFKIFFSSTEIWSMDNNDNSVNVKVAEPILSYYAYYPELFLVPSDFCSRNWKS